MADIVSSVLVYHGWYDPKKVYDSSASLDTSKDIFRIAKEVKDVDGNTVSMKYATTNTDQVWDDRASLNYY